MTAPSWSELEALFHEALARPPTDRAHFLAQCCAGRTDLHTQVEAMLRAHYEASALAVSSAASRPPLVAGVRLGAYDVLGQLGVGGMGEVYRARDTRLGRDVAIKVLPQTFASDPERLARFEREARVLAALNHPNIATIHGIEESDGIRALVMELIEGATLAERIRRSEGIRLPGARVPNDGSGRPSGLPIDEALMIARQIAEALEAAHEKGIIHRDLKPANVKITPAGTVKVLDFGLAKVTPTDAVSSQAPTGTQGGTHEGLILGTAAYMSPEQARGDPVDKRTDIWAFGCVLYELLAGRAAFARDTILDTLATIRELEPDWTALPASTPANVVRLIRRCLAKDARYRLHDIADVRIELEELLTPNVTEGGSLQHAHAGSAHPRSIPLRRRLATYSAPALIAGLAVAIGVWIAMRPGPPRVLRLAITTTPASALTISGIDRDLAITPDGSRVVYVGNDGREVFVRRLDALEPTSLFVGTPRAPFVSPDGEWVGFTDGATVLRKVSIAGGPSVTIATTDGATRGAAWTPDDIIIFATNAPATGLQQVNAAGGSATVLTKPDRTRGEAEHLWPEILPGGRAVLFTILPITGALDAAQIAVFDRQTGAQTVVVRGASHAHYVGSGHLVYAAANTLRAVAFDPVTLKTHGMSATVLPEVATVTAGSSAGAVNAMVAGDGTLAYVVGSGAGFGPRTLVWVDRQGQETPLTAPPRGYVFPRVSPEGGRIAVRSGDQEDDLWLWDLARATLTRLTFTPGLDISPVWTPDGRRLIFGSDREGVRNIFWQAADGTGIVERLTRSPNIQSPTAIAPDGTRLIFTETAPTTGDDVMQVELTGNRTVTSLVQSRSVERNGIVSPNGRWLAYEANDSGQPEIYVRPYPDVNSGYWQVSMDGGTRPLWSRSGQELLYVSGTGAILRVGVRAGASWAATAPATVVKEGYMTAAAVNPGRTYDISPDGQRLLVVKASTTPRGPLPQVVVVQHFDEELRRLAPTN